MRTTDLNHKESKNYFQNRFAPTIRGPIRESIVTVTATYVGMMIEEVS